jgi:hypothetical protein
MYEIDLLDLFSIYQPCESQPSVLIAAPGIFRFCFVARILGCPKNPELGPVTTFLVEE